MTHSPELTLRDIYYSPKTGYRSAEHLYQLAKEENSDVTRKITKQWLEAQDSYTKHKKYINPYHFRHTFVRDLGEQVVIPIIGTLI